MAIRIRALAIGIGALSAVLMLSISTPEASGDLHVTMTPIRWVNAGYSPFEAQNYSQEKYVYVQSKGYVGDYFCNRWFWPK